ncbi:MAG: hypothetical protein JW778_04805 [Candidatus Altiarchaeota archaeon]|nr:hypothetical protein [Candidatus Altiarchaeota archaeon]
MAEIVVKLPGVRLDKATASELRADIKSLVRLRLTRDLILKRVDKLLEKSELTDEQCSKLSRSAEGEIISEWKRQGWL